MRDINYYLGQPDELLKKKPFIRGGEYKNTKTDTEAGLTDVVTASLPELKGKIIGQETFLQEYNPSLHSINSNKSIPPFRFKIDGSEEEIVDVVVASAKQKNIHTKQVLHLCANDLELTMLGSNDDARQRTLFDKIFGRNKDTNLDEKSINEKMLFSKFKQEWSYRNLKQYRDKAVSIQKSTGDSGTLFVYDKKANKTKIKNLSFADGYVIIPNYDEFGDTIAVSLYYETKEAYFIKTYTDTHVYTFKKDIITETNTVGNLEFTQVGSGEVHGFNTIPLIYKRGYVAWEFAQSAIEMYEIIMAINAVVMKRFGWNWLYFNGSIDNMSINAGDGVTVVTNTNPENEKADLKYINYPEAIGIDKMLEKLDDEIQTASSTTMILPKYIKAGNDISGTAVKVTMSMDYELALQTANDWQEWCDKFVDLFCQALGREEGRIDKYTSLRIKGCFKVWMPESETQYNQMILQLKQTNVISTLTATERCTVSAPDEYERILHEQMQNRQNEIESENSNVDSDTNQLNIQTT